jgi:hypothetical protein
MPSLCPEPVRNALSMTRDRRTTDCSVKIARIELLSEELMDALSMTREKVRVWVAPLPDTQTYWRRRTI